MNERTAGAGWIERFDEPPSGHDRVLPLAEAVARAVRPGMTIHFAFTHNRPTAAMAALLKRFRGSDPKLTLLHLFTAGPAAALVTEGLVERLVTTLICEPYPAPGPSLPVRRTHAGGTVAVEHWSILSYVARLQAAALGLPSVPVRSLRGSTIADENRAWIEPAGDTETVSVKALVPDISFLHAPAADRFGNVLLAPPYGEGAWGALAARDGVVVTVERLVEPQELRRHAHLVGIPASYVRSVSVVPFGAHPAGLAVGGIEGVEPYGDDVAFYSAGREAGANDESWKRWVEEWLTGPADRDAYLAKLGAERLLQLKGKARPDSWRPELLAALEAGRLGDPPTPLEAMVAAAARLIAAKVRNKGHRAILSGFGAANLAAWLARDELVASGEEVALVAELGLYGYTPRPCDPFLFNFRNLATCTLATDATTALGALVGGSRARCLGTLGAGQVDAQGNFNSTRLADGTLLTGSGGANDVASAADDVVIVMPAGRGRLVEQLPYVTGPGERVTAVVTDLGVLEKERGPGRLRLTRLVGLTGEEDREAHVRELRERCGFAFDVQSELAVEPTPDPVDLERMRIFDPERAFLGTAPGANSRV